MLRLETPWFLIFLVLAAGLPALNRRRRLQPGLRLSGFIPSGLIRRSFWVRARPLVNGLKWAALFLMLLALAGPQKGTKEIEILTEGIDIMLAVDLSESMAALDFKLEGEVVNRLRAVKGVVRDFISKRYGDRIGLVVFGSEAYTQSPLTRDYEALMAALDRLDIGSAGKTTAVGDALGICLKRLKEVESKSRIVILLTDGRSNTGEISPETAAGLAAQAGVKVYTIGVGGHGPAPFLVDHPLTGRRVIYQQVDIDEDTLKKIAGETGGMYFHAQDTGGLKETYDRIDGLEKSEVKIKTYAEYHDLYPYLLVPALLFLVLYVILSQTRYLKVP